MEDNSSTEYSVSTFKVDFGCSKGSPNKVRNMLQQVEGVKSVSIDLDEGKVRVVGNVNPTKLINIFEKMGKKAQLYSFVKEPKKSQCRRKHKHHSSRSYCESSDSGDEFETDLSDDHHLRRHRTRHDQRYDHNERHGLGNEYAPPPMPMPMPMPRYHGPPMSGYHHYPHHPPSMPWNQHMAYAYARPPPPHMDPRARPMYGYYGSGQAMRPGGYGSYDSRFPRYNPMVNYADNYRHMM